MAYGFAANFEAMLKIMLFNGPFIRYVNCGLRMRREGRERFFPATDFKGNN